MLELSEKTVKISQTLILFKMNTTTKTTPTAKVLTGKVPTTVGKISFLFILMLNFAFSFFSSLGRTIKKNADAGCDGKNVTDKQLKINISRQMMVVQFEITV